MIIDGHAHSAGEFHAAESVVRVLDPLGVDKVVLCPGPINEPVGLPIPNITRPLNDRRMNFVGNKLIRLALQNIPEKYNLDVGNTHVAAMADRYPGRILQAYWVDPADRRMIEDVPARHRDYEFRVLKVHQCWEPYPADGPAMHDLAEFAGARGLPFFVHIYDRPDAFGLVRLAAAHPRTAFILAHCLGLAVFLEADPDDVRNVSFDISPPNMVPETRIRAALRHFGPERLLQGSDTPFGKENLRASLRRVRGLGLPRQAERLILGGNMARLLSL